MNLNEHSNARAFLWKSGIFSQVGKNPWTWQQTFVKSNIEEVRVSGSARLPAGLLLPVHVVESGVITTGSDCQLYSILYTYTLIEYSVHACMYIRTHVIFIHIDAGEKKYRRGRKEMHTRYRANQARREEINATVCERPLQKIPIYHHIWSHSESFDIIKRQMSNT